MQCIVFEVLVLEGEEGAVVEGEVAGAAGKMARGRRTHRPRVSPHHYAASQAHGAVFCACQVGHSGNIAGKVLRLTQSKWRSACLRPQWEGTPGSLLPSTTRPVLPGARYTGPASHLGLDGWRPRVRPMAVLYALPPGPKHPRSTQQD